MHHLPHLIFFTEFVTFPIPTHQPDHTTATENEGSCASSQTQKAKQSFFCIRRGSQLKSHWSEWILFSLYSSLLGSQGHSSQWQLATTRAWTPALPSSNSQPWPSSHHYDHWLGETDYAFRPSHLLNMASCAHLGTSYTFKTCDVQR